MRSKRAKQFRCQLTACDEEGDVLRKSGLIYVQAPDRDAAVWWLHANEVEDFLLDGEELKVTAVQVPDEVAMEALGPEIAPPLPFLSEVR